jgi:hypothetical protein
MRTLSQALFSTTLLQKSLFYKGFLQHACRLANARRAKAARASGASRALTWRQCCDSRCEVGAKRVFRQRLAALSGRGVPAGSARISG